MAAPDRSFSDVNYRNSLIVVSSTDGISPVSLWADPTTHALVTSGGGTGGGGTQYTDGAAAVTHPVGTQEVFTNGSGIVTAVSTANPLPVSASVTPAPNVISTVNSSTTTLAGAGTFTGTSEDVSAYADLRIAVFSDVASATDGLSIQQSTNGTNWDQTDAYTIPAGTGKAFDVPVYARFFRIVYTNGATIQTSFRLQSVYHISRTKPSSQRPQDSRTNDNDMEENLSYNNIYDSSTNTWSRAISGNGTTGLGTQRVTLSSDSTGQVKLATGANTIGSISNTSFAATQSTAAALTAGWPTINGEAGDVTGTFTNATQTTSVTANNLDGYGNTLISINGTYGTATAIFEGSDDSGTTWYTVQAARDNTNVIETGYTSLTNTSQTWQINNPGFDSLRIRSTAVASGTVNVRLSSSAAPVASGTIVGLGTSIPAGSNAIGSITNTSFVATQATGTNLHTVVDSGTLTAVTAITNALPAGANSIGTVDTELPAAAALADATTNPTVPGIGAFNETYSGTTWDRVRTAGSDSQAVTGIQAAGGMTFNGSTWDRMSGGNRFGDGGSATGAVLGAALTYNGSSFDRIRSASSTKGTTGTGLQGVGALGFDGTNYQAISTSTAGVQYVLQRSDTSTLTQVASSATSVTVLASNTARKGASIYNNSTQICYLAFASSASSTAFTVPLAAATFFEVNAGYTGIITGIWVSANGTAVVTELS